MSSKDWVYGIHTVSELLRQHPEDILELLIQQDREDKRINELKGLAAAAGVSGFSVENIPGVDAKWITEFNGGTKI